MDEATEETLPDECSQGRPVPPTERGTPAGPLPRPADPLPAALARFGIGASDTPLLESRRRLRQFAT